MTRIKIEYALPDADVLEIKKEAAAKFCAVFPDIPLKSVLQ